MWRHPQTDHPGMSDEERDILSSSRRVYRRGVTLIECLAVVIIIGVLISLLLPAVQAARETARRAQCQSNLQQIGLALRNYEATQTVLPAGTVEPSGPVANTPLGFHQSWTVAILPFLDPPAAAQVRYDQSVYSPRNLSVLVSLDRVPPWYSCPSHYSYGVECHYAGCHDDRDKPIDEDDHGVFFRNSAVRSLEIPDGTANTLFIGEKQLYPPDWGWMSGTRATLRTAAISMFQRADENQQPGYFGSPSPPSKSAEELVRNLRPDLFGSDTQPWFDLEAASVKVPDGPELPQDPQLIEELRKLGEIPEGAPVIGGFGSAHPGVTNFLFGDMSVRAVWHQVDLKLLRSLANRGDGEGIDESL